MTSAVFAIPGDIDLPTGGYTYDRRVLALLPQFGVAVRHLALPGGFPTPNAADLDDTRRLLARLLPKHRPAGRRPGLRRDAGRVDLRAADCPIVALVHHPLCLEAGLAEAAPGRALRARRRPRWRWPGTSSSPARARPARSPPTLPCRPARSPSPSPAPIRPRARAAPASRCSCWRSARSCRARPTTCWCARWPP